MSTRQPCASSRTSLLFWAGHKVRAMVEGTCAHQRAAQLCPSKSSSIVPIKEQLNYTHQ